MKTITFAEVPPNGNFHLDRFPDLTDPPAWCNKIDGVRYIYIGKSGTHCLDPNTKVLVLA